MSPRPPARTGLGAIDAERFDVASAVGGWRGVMESAAPTFVFVVVMAVRPSALVTALAASLAVSGAALTARLAQRQGLTQVLGGAVSDQLGRRGPVIVGCLTTLAGSLVCVFAPNAGVLIAGRVLQGFGGGAASSVGRAVLVDVAHGRMLARAMSLLQAVVGFAPMVAPVLGGFIVTRAPWRAVFWALAAFTLLMAVLAWRFVPESLPPGERQGGGVPRFFRGLAQVVRIRPFVGFMLTNALSSFCMFGYISNATYVLQGPLGLSPMAFAWVFAFNALLSTGFALVNVRLISHFTPRTLIITGLTIAATGVVTLAISTFLLDLPLILTCVGFALIMTATAFIFGNSGAQAMSEAREHAGTASSVMGVFQSIANGIAAPLATSGGDSAVPMVLVMIVGSLGAWFAFWVIARGGKHTPRHLSLD